MMNPAGRPKFLFMRSLVLLIFLIAINSVHAKPSLLSQKNMYDLALGTSIDTNDQFSLLAELSVATRKAKLTVYGLKSAKDNRLGFGDFTKAIEGFQSPYIKDQLGIATGPIKFDTISSSYAIIGIGITQKTQFAVDNANDLSQESTYLPHLLAKTGTQLELGVFSIGMDVYGLVDSESISIGVTGKIGLGKFWY